MDQAFCGTAKSMEITERKWIRLSVVQQRVWRYQRENGLGFLWYSNEYGDNREKMDQAIAVHYEDTTTAQ